MACFLCFIPPKSSSKSEKSLNYGAISLGFAIFLLPLHNEISAPTCRWHFFMGMQEESPGSVGHPTSETRSYW